MTARLPYSRDIVDFDELEAGINAKRSQEDQLRLPITGDVFRRLLVDNATRRLLATAEWNATVLTELAEAAERLLLGHPRPADAPEPTMWNDPLLEDWEKVEPFCDCTLVTLMQGGAEDLLSNDSELLDGLRRLTERADTRTGHRAQSVLDRLAATGPVATPSWWLSLEQDEQESGPASAAGSL